VRGPEAVTPTPTRSPRALLRPAARRALDESVVSLLVPDDPALLATADVRAGNSWAAISFARGDHTLTVHASREGPPREPTRRGRPAADVPWLDRVRGAPALIIVGEGHRVATWVERGVTYTLDLSCVSADDPRCARERYLHELASGLVPVGDAR